jgi:hypothetical protein
MSTKPHTKKERDQISKDLTFHESETIVASRIVQIQKHVLVHSTAVNMLPDLVVGKLADRRCKYEQYRRMGSIEKILIEWDEFEIFNE